MVCLEMTGMNDNRRTDPRFVLNCPAKVYNTLSRKYSPCTAIDVSRGGALIEVKPRIPVTQGMHLMLGIASNEQRGLLHAQDMLEVCVLRALVGPDDRQTLAVRFVHDYDVAINSDRMAA